MIYTSFLDVFGTLLTLISCTSDISYIDFGTLLFKSLSHTCTCHEYTHQPYLKHRFTIISSFSTLVAHGCRLFLVGNAGSRWPTKVSTTWWPIDLMVMTHQCYLYPDDPRKILPFIKRYQEIYSPSRDMASTKRIPPLTNVPPVFRKTILGSPPFNRGGRTSHAREVEILSVRESQKKSGGRGRGRFFFQRGKNIGPSDVPKFNEDTVDRRNPKQQPLYGCINKTWDKQRDKLPFPQLVKPRRISAINYR